MGKYFNKLKTNFVLKNTYIKMLLIYASFTFFAVMLSSSILYTNLSKKLESEIYLSNKGLLMQIRIFSDTYLVDKVENIVREKFLDISRNENMLGFFQSSNNDNIVVDYRAYKDLQNTIINNSFIKSIYLYRVEGDTLVSTNEGINYKISMPGSIGSKCVNWELISKSMVDVKYQTWITPEENRSFWKGENIITLIQILPMFTKEDVKIGCVAINIDINKFFNSINEISDDREGKLMIVDSSGKTFTTDISEDFLDELRHNGIMSNITSTNDGFGFSDFDNSRFGVTWTSSNSNDWKYVSILPVENLIGKIFLAKQFFYLLIGMFLLLSFLGMNIITSYIYKPLKKLKKSATDLFNIKEKKSDIKTIDNIIIKLSKKYEEMESVIKKNENLFEYKVAIDIMNGNIESEEEIKERLFFAKHSFIYEYYCLVITEIKPDIMSSITVEKKEFVNLKLIDIINAFFASLSCQSISIDLPPNYIVSILNFSDLRSSKKIIYDLLIKLHSENEIDCNISVGAPCTTISSISITYKATIDFLKYSFIRNYNNVFLYDQITSSNDGTAHFEKYISDVEILLKSNKLDPLKELITKTASEIKAGMYSLEYVQTLLTQITGLIVRIFRERGIKGNNMDSGQIMADFNKIKNMDDYICWILSLINVYSSHINELSGTINHNFTEGIAKFITENVNDQISLSSVADHFKLSQSHLSRLFKDTFGVNFSEFVINKKFEKAMILLRSEKKINIAEISSMVGYQNKSYFTKLFKEKFGLTPMQYRKNYTSRQKL